MQQPVALPAGLAEHPPGPQLCALLADLDTTQVSNHATVVLLRAWRRLRSHVEAEELRVLAELGRRDTAADPHTLARADQPDPGCVLEIATALTVTENAAARDHNLAETLVWRLPAVHAALAAGQIDRAKAWVFADYLGDEELTDACVARVLGALLPRAPGLTTGQLRARIQRMLIAADPDAARRRYRAAVRERRVVCYLDRDGAATISVIGLDPAAAQASCERVDALARAVREAGHPDSLSRIRVELFTALTDGTVHAMSNDQIIATLLARAAARDTDTDSDSDEGPVGPVHNEKVARARRWAEADRARRSAGPAGTHSGAGTDDEPDPATHGQASAGGRTGADDESDSGTHDEGADNRTGHHRTHTADHESGTGSETGTDRSGAGSHSGSGSEGGSGGEDRTDDSVHSDGQDDTAGSGVGTNTDDGDTGHGQACAVVHDSADDSAHPADEPDPDDPGPDDHGPTPPPGPDTGPDQPDTPSDSSSGGGGGAAPSPSVEAPPERARTGIEIRIRLSTLLGHDQHPAEIPGLGPLLAGPARDTVARHHYAEWRFAITDPDGHLLLAGHTRHRPTTGTTPTPQPEPRPGPRSKRRQRSRPKSRPGAGQSHGGVVELQIPATLLTALVLDPPPGWERLIADLATQYARRHHLRAALNRHPHARFPHRALRRHIEVRDRTCSFPGCRRPARKAQQDHTHEHRHGGVTVEANLGPLCVFHHAIKTAGHWHLVQPRPGTFRWTSPLHHRYLTRGEPVCPPLPDPVPPEDSAPTPDTGYGPRSPAQDALDEKPLFPEPEAKPQPEPDATGDGATGDDTVETVRDMTETDDAPDRKPADEPDDDEPPF